MLTRTKFFSKNGAVTDPAWFASKDLPKKLVDDYRKLKGGLLENEATTSTCNTDKTKVYTCELKSRTCGIQIICSNCGIIEGFRELLGSESCTQVADMLVKFRQEYTGI